MKSTGVKAIEGDTPVICRVFNMLGACMGTVETTPSEAVQTVKRNLSLHSGIYLLRMEADGKSQTIKIQII